MSGAEVRRRVSTEQQPQSQQQNSPPRKDDFILSEVKVHNNSGKDPTDCCDCAVETPKVPASGRVRKSGRMETVTVTVGCQGETEATTRERKISRVRKNSDALHNHVTMNHGGCQAQIETRERNINKVRKNSDALNNHVTMNHGGGGGCQSQIETRERKISRVRKMSNVLNDFVTPSHEVPYQSGMDGTPRERKISKVRKISDALVSIVTMNHQNHHGPTVIGTLSSANSVSLADLLRAEEELDTRSISSGSIDYTSGGIANHAFQKDDGGMGPGHVLGTGASSDASAEWADGKQWPQVVASIAANMGAFAFGAVLAWSATGIASMQDTEDLGELSTSMSSWIGSIPTLGAVAACPFAGFALDALGRKRSMLYLTLPFVIGWLFIGLAQNFFMVLFGRFVTGFCGGCFSIAAPIFTAETADASIRGGLGSLFDLLMSTGMLYIYVVGVFLSWRYQAIACAIIPVAFHIIMYFVPESPRYLVQRDKEHKAEKAIYWLKGSAIDPESVQKEIGDLRTSVGETQGAAFSFIAIFQRTLIMPTAIMIGIMFFTTLTGVDAIIAYTVTIFESAGSTMDPKLSTIIIGIVTMLASFPTAAVVDIAGRRILLMASELVMAIALGIMGLYHFMMRTDTVLFGAIHYQDFTWVPLASLVLFIIGFSLGCGPLSMMMIGELLPNRLKGLTSCTVLMTRWFLAFGVTNIFGTLKDVLNDDGTYWLFASVCFVGIFYVFFFVPETKGKSLAEIQLYFIGHKQNNIAIATQQEQQQKDKQQNNGIGGLHGYDNKIDVEA